MNPSLSAVGWILGLGVIALRSPGLVVPEWYGRQIRRFPRHFLAGAILLAIAAVWVAWYLWIGVTGSWAWARPYAIAAVPIGYVIALRYLEDYLAVRAVAVLLMLLAKPMVEAARWHPSPLRLVVTITAYVWVIAAMILIVSPYRMRDIAAWASRSPVRLRGLCAIAVLFGIGVCILAATVYPVE